MKTLLKLQSMIRESRRALPTNVPIVLKYEMVLKAIGSKEKIGISGNAAGGLTAPQPPLIHVPKSVGGITLEGDEHVLLPLFRLHHAKDPDSSWQRLWRLSCRTLESARGRFQLRRNTRSPKYQCW